MPKLKLFLALVFVVLISACANVGKLMATGAVPTSKYTPMWMSSNEFDDFLNVIRPVSGQVVKDELGTYYYNINNKEIYGMAMYKEDEEVLRSLLSGAVGLMEPMYTYDGKGLIVVDWKATEKRYAFLTNELKLKLLPISETKKYAEISYGYTKSIMDKKGGKGGFGYLGAIFEGNLGDISFYNSEFSNDILSKISGEFNYLIMSGLTETYGLGSSMPSATIEQRYFLLDSAINSVESNVHAQIRFAPKAYFDSMKKGGLRHYSTCFKWDIDGVKKMADRNTSMMNNPIGNASKAKNATERDIAAKQKELQVALAQAETMRTEVEKACRLGIKEFQISGAIQSRSLK